MITLLVLGLMFGGALLSLLLIPLFLLRVVLGLSIAVLAIPLHAAGAILGGVTRGLFKGVFWLAVLLIPLALIAFPFTIMVFGAWLLYRVVRPKRAPAAYVVA